MLTEDEVSQVIKVLPCSRFHAAGDGFPPAFLGAELWGRQSCQGPYLLDLCLQVTQLHALLQVLAVLLRRHVQLLLLLVQELQQVLHTSGHVHVPVAQQLHTCSQDGPLGMTRKASQIKQPVSTGLH